MGWGAPGGQRLSRVGRQVPGRARPSFRPASCSAESSGTREGRVEAGVEQLSRLHGPQGPRLGRWKVRLEEIEVPVAV